MNETRDKAASGGIDACPTAYDFWVAGAGASRETTEFSRFTKDPEEK